MRDIEVRSEVTGTVWKLVAEAGAKLAKDDVILIVESMKMEIPVVAPSGGVLQSLEVAEGDLVEEGQLVGRISP